MTPLAHAMGLSKDLQFYDVYSLSDPELLAYIPRPVFALLVILPLTPTWEKYREAEDAGKGVYGGKGGEEPVSLSDSEVMGWERKGKVRKT